MLSGVEIRRKIVHLVTLSIPIGYALMAKETVFSILLLLFLGFLSVDLLRHYHSGMASLFRKYFLGTVLREKERATLMGSTYFLFSTLLTILLFPKPIAIASILILILADTSAALVGRGIGKIPIFGKTLEGSLAFLLCAFLIVWIYPNLDLFSGSLAALGATLIEILPTRIDDNLTIPLVAAAIMVAL
ncbi:MAG: phosphatidate cytidylyltransferase [Thermodesulfobacteriota bacterium]|jgi:dolichol kinase